MRIAQFPADIPFRALTAQIAKAENVSADTAAAHAAALPAPVDDRDANPRIKLRLQLCCPSAFDQLQPPHRVKPTYDLAAYLARRCAQAYLTSEEIRKIVTDDGGSEFEYFECFSDAAFGYRRGSTIVIAFRGTTGGWNAVRQWPLTNLRAFPVRRPWRHLGFQMAWERLRPEMVEWIERTRQQDSELVLTGHSLGGAIAVLAAFELARDYPVRAVVTIGAPRVGLLDFRDAYLKKSSRPLGIGVPAVALSEVTRRITHADDIVSRMPPGPVYRHVGEESRLDAQGTLSRGDSRGALQRLFAGLDGAVGWCYQQLDALRMTPAHGVSTQVGAVKVMGTIPHPILRVFDDRKEARPLRRLANDAMKVQHRFPFLSMVTLTSLQWTLGAVGAAVSCGVFLISLVDFGSHRSRLYVDAFLRRYSMPEFRPSAEWSAFVKRALEEAKRKV